MNLDANKDMTVFEDKIDQVRAHIYKNRRNYAIAGGVVGVTAIGVAGYFLGAGRIDYTPYNETRLTGKRKSLTLESLL